MTQPLEPDRFGRFVNRRELDALAGRLEDGEELLAAGEARADRLGVLAITTRRVLHVSKGWLRTRVYAWPNRAIVKLVVATTVDDATLTLHLEAGSVPLRLAKADAKRLKAAWERRPKGPNDLLDFALPAAEKRRGERLARLDRLRARGAITKSEYERAKRAAAEEPSDD